MSTIDRQSMRIAFIGSRGVPATWGGIEHHVEELGSRLAARGHDVTVFCRRNYVDEVGHDYDGMHLRTLPTISSKHLDAIVHSTMSSMLALRGFDIVHYHALGPGLPAPVVRYCSHARVVLTVHGLDGERAKWGRVARTVLQAAEWMSARVPDATVVVSNALAEYYLEVYSRPTSTIVNGVTAKEPLPPGPTLERLGLIPGRYVLYVGRLVPEKSPDALIRAFRETRTDMSLALVGGSSFTDGFSAEVQRLAHGDSRIVMPGYLYGNELREIYSNAAVFVLPSMVEGLPLTLLEAASYGLPVIASAIPPHVEVLQSSGPGQRLVPPDDEAALRHAIEEALSDLAAERRGAKALRSHVLATYSWDVATAAHEQLFRELLQNGRRRLPVVIPAQRTVDAPSHGPTANT